MATRKKKETEPTVVKGSHLTVTTYPDGRTELKWDDEQLAKDVREAIASVEKKPNVKAKAEVRKKKVEPSKILNSVEEAIQAVDNAKKSSKIVVKKTVVKKKTK